MKNALLITAICFCLISCSSAQECKEGLNLLPMYGNVPKCDEQLKLDKDFISSTTSQFSNRKTAAIALVDKAWGYFYKNDLETSMKRFNQAWLLDSLNADVYWGFGNLLGKKGEFKTVWQIVALRSKITGIVSLNTIYDLFTEFTFLFTTQITQYQKHQARFGDQFKRHETHEKNHLCADLTTSCGKRTCIC